MRDRFSCFSENSVIFSQPSSSSSSKSNPSSSLFSSSSPSPSSSSPSPANSLLPSVQNAVTSVYRITSSAQKPLFITLSWYRSPVLGQTGLTIGFGSDSNPNSSSSSSSSFKLISSGSRLFKRNRGSKRIELERSRAVVEVFWDFSNARFDHGPEPVGGFYVVVVVDSELGLFLGDMAEDAVEKKFNHCWNQTVPRFSLVSRREHCSGNAIYRTRCQFGETGSEHDIVIRVSGESGCLDRDPMLSVYIDRKKVMRVKRLEWNFRGSQTIFMDGTDLIIDMLWDVHDWFFGQATEGRRGVFMFTTRSSSSRNGGLVYGRFEVEEDEERLVEKYWEKDHLDRADDFSLIIYATKNS